MSDPHDRSHGDAPAPDAATRGFLRGTARDRGYERIAKFLMLIGKEPAAGVLEHLTEEEVAGITAQIARTHSVERREAFRILEEFGYLMKTRDLFARGGTDKARELLRKLPVRLPI